VRNKLTIAGTIENDGKQYKSSQDWHTVGGGVASCYDWPKGAHGGYGGDGGKRTSGSSEGGVALDFCLRSYIPYEPMFYLAKADPMNNRWKVEEYVSGETVPENTLCLEPVRGGAGGGGESDSRGGCGGGVIHVIAKEIEAQSGNEIRAVGYSGGGGGGFILIVTNKITGTLNTNVQGGSGYQAGSPGRVVIITPPA